MMMTERETFWKQAYLRSMEHDLAHSVHEKNAKVALESFDKKFPKVKEKEEEGKDGTKVSGFSHNEV